MERIYQLVNYLEDGRTKDKVIKTSQEIPILIAKGNGQCLATTEYANIAQAIDKAGVLQEQLAGLMQDGEITKNQLEKLKLEIDEVRKLLFGYRNSLGRKIYGNRKGVTHEQ